MVYLLTMGPGLLPLPGTTTINISISKRAPRITDFVPPNFLCDSRTMQKILKDEEALRLLDERLSVLGTRRHSLDDELELEQLISDASHRADASTCSIETHKSLLAYPQSALFRENCSGDNSFGDDIDDEEPAAHPLIWRSPAEKAEYWKGLERRIEAHCISIRITPGGETMPEFVSIMDDAKISQASRVRTARVDQPSTLASATGNQNDAVFEHLTLPALRSLSVGLHHPTKSWPRPSNTAFIRRSGCTLTERGFRGCPVHDKRLLEILSAQTALVTFKLNLFNDSDNHGKRHAHSDVNRLYPFYEDKGGEGLPLPALTVLRLAVLPRHLTDVKRLIQLRSADVAKKDRVARLG
ncbi:hypothetical protein CPB85DRAFT_1456634 [Mucidula mucida]|nr:hypothetical protein CPB85DRAFT_1456634 [Mucidula mucida]